MSATPKIYSSSQKSKALENDNEVFSMDDEEIFGNEILNRHCVSLQLYIRIFFKFPCQLTGDFPSALPHNHQAVAAGRYL